MNGETARWDRIRRDYDARLAAYPLPIHTRHTSNGSTASLSLSSNPSQSHLSARTTSKQRLHGMPSCHQFSTNPPLPPHRSFSNPTVPPPLPPHLQIRSPSRPSSRGQEYQPQLYSPPQVHRRGKSYDPLLLEREPKRSTNQSSKPWPPAGYDARDALPEERVEELVCNGASKFKGLLKDWTHAPGESRLYAVMEDESEARNDCADFQDVAFAAMTLPLTGASDSPFPWVALEQPCMRYAYGKSAGTTTMTFFVGKVGAVKPSLHYGSEAKPRKMKLGNILERLNELELGIEAEHPEETYRQLYENLLEDPEQFKNPHFDRALQIADLLSVLANPEWFDFSKPRNQIVSKFMESPDEKIKRVFFFQLLLAVELYLRIQASDHEETPKSVILEQIPPKVAWDLALAQRWLENMSVTKTSMSATQSTFDLRLKSKQRQKEALRKFATLLKWPNMEEIDHILAEQDSEEKELEDRSAESMSWFSGLVLPGSSLPFIAINALIECDRDTERRLNFLSHMFPKCGFQYRGNTYWSSQSILGRVLGASRGTREVAGWIGPCNFSPDLDRTECILLKQSESKHPKLSAADVNNMADSSHPLGLTALTSYLLQDFEVPMHDASLAADSIRMQKISLREIPEEDQDKRSRKVEAKHDVQTCEAGISFAVGGDTWTLNCKFNVDFICAFPCANGPHALHRDYKNYIVGVDDELLDLQGWSSSKSKRVGSGKSSDLARHKSFAALPSAATKIQYEEGDILVIEALGVSDNEVFARAWCAHWDAHAVVANINTTCIACAVREAVAIKVGVVILTEGGRTDEREEDASWQVDQ